MASRRQFLAYAGWTFAMWPFRGLSFGELTVAVDQTLASALTHLKSAKRISAPTHSYASDNPAEYQAVLAYLNGGARPSPTTEMGKGLTEVEDARREAAGVVVPPPPPPPSGALGVDRATMLATGGTVLRSDVSEQSDPRPGLWGQFAAGASGTAEDMSRHSLVLTDGDPRPRADGQPQGNSNFRRIKVLQGDNWGGYGKRSQLGRNNRQNGENTGTQTAGTFALYKEGEHKLTFFSLRFRSGFWNMGTNTWQQIMQLKQAQPYAANGPVNGAPILELQLDVNKLHLRANWTEVWSTPAPPMDKWIRFALDIVHSKDPNKGSIQVFVDNDGDGDFLDADEASPVFIRQTLAHCTSAGSGLVVGDPIPSYLSMPVYVDSAISGEVQVDMDNVQVVG